MSAPNPKNTLTIIIARMGSSRLPGKILKKIGNYSVLEFIVERCKELKNWPNVILATSNLENDKLLVESAKKIGIKPFTGSETNVASRFYQSAKDLKRITWLHRLNADNVFFDFDAINSIYTSKIKDNFHMISNVNHDHTPGFSIELVKKIFYKNSMLHFSDIHKEHVTKYFYDNLKKYNNSIHWLMNDRNYNDLALDNANDLKKVNALIENYGVGPKTKVSSIQKALKDFNLK